MTTAPTTLVAQSRSSHHVGVDVSGFSTVKDAMEAAGLNWEPRAIIPESVSILSPEGVTQSRVPNGTTFITRSDTQDIIGVVGSKYSTVSNAVLGDVADFALGAGGVLHRAGETGGGSKVFIDVAFPSIDVKIPGPRGDLDFVKMALRIENTHDGSGQFQARIIARRLACMNGMTVALRGVASSFQIRHTGSAELRASGAARAVQGIIRYAKSFSAVAHHLLDTPMSKTEFMDFVDALYPAPEGEVSPRSQTMHERRRSELVNLFTFAETNKIGRGSAWGALNSVTEYVDWVAPVRSAGNTPDLDVRALRQFAGRGSDVKDRAMELLGAA